MVNEIGLTEDTTTRTDEVKAVVTLISGRELQTAAPELVKSAPVVAEPLQEAPVNFWPWTKEEEITALLTEKSSGHETVEGTQETILQLIPMKLNPSATAQPQNNPLPVYILPLPAAQPIPKAPTKKSNLSLPMLKNFKSLVAIVHNFATTSNKMSAAYTAWHSGWFGCRFGFGAPEPWHF